MRVPVSWLAEYVALPDDVTLEHLHSALVSVGFEEEDVHGFDVTGPLVVGRVLEISPEPQSNGKTINWCQVDVGDAEPRGIVCGAHNFVVGDHVVVALPGAVLPGPFPIAARKTYGHVSDGMICSTRELGLGDDHDGILRLVEIGVDADPGADAIALLGLADAAIEINVTPDRGYALSLRGVAREYATATGARYSDPADAVTVSPASGFAVEVQDDRPIHGRVASEVFVTRVVRGVDATAPTPPWMVARLKLAGIRSISLPVDITNYVCLELGQPIHAYDLDRLAGGITVRRAAAGEKLTTLDESERTLHLEDIVIADESGAIGLAGVMGGASTEVTETTTNILVEAANFDPVSIARTARRHKLWSEASKRFERGVDPAVAVVAAQRVVDLLVEFAGGSADPLGSLLDAAPAAVPLSLPKRAAAGLIGVEYTDDETVSALTSIGATVEPAADGWLVTAPSWRPDLGDVPTWVEEIARVVGYDRIPSRVPTPPPGRGLTRHQLLRRVTANSLAGAGFVETLTYPFSSRADLAAFEAGEPTAVALANAFDPATSWMRRSMIPGLLHVARRNTGRGITSPALFEVGRVFLPASRELGTVEIPVGAEHPGADALAALDASLPEQPWRVAVLATGDEVAAQPNQSAVPVDVTTAVDAVQALAASLGVVVALRQAELPGLHPGRAAEVLVGDEVVGRVGEVLPALAADWDLAGRVAVAELDLDALIRVAPAAVGVSPLATATALTQDLSLVVPAEVPADAVRAVVAAGIGELLEEIRIVDDYRGQGVDDGHKSLTFALRFRASDRTLTQAEATEAKLAGVAAAEAEFGATLRA